jgi:hypothetical protein
MRRRDFIGGAAVFTPFFAYAQETRTYRLGVLNEKAEFSAVFRGASSARLH